MGPLGGTWGHMVTCLSIQYVTQPFRVYPGDKGTFRGTGGPLGASKPSSKVLEMDLTT